MEEGKEEEEDDDEKIRRKKEEEKQISRKNTMVLLWLKEIWLVSPSQIVR